MAGVMPLAAGSFVMALTHGQPGTGAKRLYDRPRHISAALRALARPGRQQGVFSAWIKDPRIAADTAVRGTCVPLVTGEA